MTNPANMADTPGRVRPVMIAFVCGAAIGAAAGLLLAPAHGRVLRRQVADTARRASRRAATSLNGVSTAVADVMSRSRQAFEAGRVAYRNGGAAGDRTVRPAPSAPMGIR